MLQNEWQLHILDRLYQIIFEMIILSRIGTDRYRNRIFEILLLSLLGELWRDTKLHRFLAKFKGTYFRSLCWSRTTGTQRLNPEFFVA